MESRYVYSRTASSWQLTFVHAAKTAHLLTRALLMTTASAGMAMAGLCCWIDRFRSSKGASWMMPMSPKRATSGNYSEEPDIPHIVFEDKIPESPKRAVNQNYSEEPEIPRKVFEDKIPEPPKRAVNQDYSEEPDVRRNVFGDRIPAARPRTRRLLYSRDRGFVS